MSEELKTKMTDHTASTYWGGDDRGVCVQIQASEPLKLCDSLDEQIQQEGFIQLTLEEAVELRNTLSHFIYDEARRRQTLLKEKLKELRLAERTIFHEVVELDPSLLEAQDLAIKLIANTCPKQ